MNPLCPVCDCELEDDSIFGVMWCWRCSQPYTLEDGYLIAFTPDSPVTDVNVGGHLL